MTDACVFCTILAGDAAASVVYGDDIVCAFMDIQPVTPGHVLVVPRTRAASFADLDAEVAARVFQTAQSVARAIRRSSVRCDGINLFLADGVAAGQEVFHAHLHVFPRYPGDGFGLRYAPTYHSRPDRASLDAVAESIRGAHETIEENRR